MWKIKVCLIISLLLYSISPVECQSVQEKSDYEKLQIEHIKKELNFSEWRSKSYKPRPIDFRQFRIERLIPEGVQCQSQEIEFSVPSFHVKCSRINKHGITENISFNVHFFASVDEAHEGVIRYFQFVSAPISHLKKLWAEEKIAYGDKSFGADFWVRRNIIFNLSSGYEHKNFIRYLFRSIDDAIKYL